MCSTLVYKSLCILFIDININKKNHSTVLHSIQFMNSISRRGGSAGRAKLNNRTTHIDVSCELDALNEYLIEYLI